MAQIYLTPLLNNVNVDTVGEPLPIFATKPHTLAVQADDLGGGNITIEWSVDADSWDTLIDTSGNLAIYTQNVLKVNLTFESIYLRATLSGSTNAQNVFVGIS
jgi:hypothetical protein